MRYTLAELIDKLTIVNIKVFMAVDRQNDKSLSDAEIASATDVAHDGNKLRNKLIGAINKLSVDLANGSVDVNDFLGLEEIKIYKKNGKS